MQSPKESPQLQLLSLTNSRHTELKILNFGATIFSLEFQKKNKEKINVVVGPEKPKDYLGESYHKKGKYFGSSVGRYAGRISNGSFEIDGKKYDLYTKDGVHLHGGKYGFSYKFWEVEEVNGEKNPSVLLSYLSENGEEGYPGNLRVKVKYTLTEEDEVKIDYTATTDEKTFVNLTNHTYFNLQGRGNIDRHRLQLEADRMLETDEQLMPTGNLLKVEGTSKDFRVMKAVDQIPLDTAFAFTGPGNSGKKIILESAESGISLQVYTQQPAVVVYVPEVLPQDWEYTTAIAEHRQAICLETQNFPDAPHHSSFPSALLKPDEIYKNRIVWKFKIDQNF